MLCEVTLHRRNGQRLRKSELSEPFLGDIHLHEMGAENSNFRRSVRRLTLTEHPGNSIRILAVLFDPVLIGLDVQTMQYQGIELESRGDLVREHIQIWSCRPVRA